MKKILFVIDERKMGGTSIILENIFRELKNYNFDLLVLHNNGDRFQKLDNVNIIYGSKFFEVVDLSLKEIVKMHNISLLLKKINMIFLIKTGLIKNKIINERKKILKKQYDIEVSFKDGFGTFFVAYGDSKYKIRWLHADYSNNDPGRHYNKTFVAALSKFNKFIAISKSVGEKFNKKYHFENKTEIIYNLIDKSKCRPRKKIKKDNYRFELVTVGRLHPIKGYDRVLKAINKLKKEGLFNNCVFKIVGDGPMKFQLQKYIKENNLNQNVILYGANNYPWDYIQNGDLFILSSYSEAFPTTVIESLLNHIPVLSVEYSSAREVLNDKNSLLVKNTDQAIYEGLKELITNQNKLNKLKENVKKYDYNNKIIKSQLIECLGCEDNESE